MLRDIDDTLQRRIERVAQRHCWSLPEALAQLLEAGLQAHDGPSAQAALDGGENEVLVRAIAAMERLPNDPGFALIGRGHGPGSCAAR